MLRMRAWGTSRFIEPCPPSLAKQPPIGPKWFHKRGGFRIMARHDPAGVRLIATPLRAGKELIGKSAGNFGN